MAITGRLVDDKASTTDATSYASDTPSAGSVTETHIAWIGNTHGTTATLPTLSGGGLTWTQIVSNAFGGLRGTAFRSRGINTAAAITADFGATTQTGCIIAWGGFAGVDGTTNEGVVQSVFGNEAGNPSTTGFSTLAALGANSAVVCVAVIDTNSAMSPEAGFTELSDVGYATPDTHAHMMWAVTTDTAGVHTAASSSNWRIVALELKALAALSFTVGEVAF